MKKTHLERSNLQGRIDMHRNYWERTVQPHPLAAFRVAEDFYVARHFRGAEHLLTPGKRIHPEMLVVDEFLEDYERMYAVAEELGQDAFWTAEPYPGIPWMEAILGSEVIGGNASFTTEPWVQSAEELDALELNPGNPWLSKYLEFCERLAAISKGRFPVGMPIMRGPSDMIGALMGQTEMVYAMADDPERMKRAFLKVTDIFLQVIREQRRIAGEFHGGESMGFYHVYCPGTCIWFQEDLSALLSPDLYREFLAEPARLICRDYQYTAIHLHPTSFFLLDEILQIDGLKAIEVNKDVGGPSVPEMIPHLQKIMQTRNLILWGDLTPADLACVREQLPHRGLFFHIITPTIENARELLSLVRSWEDGPPLDGACE